MSHEWGRADAAGTWPRPKPVWTLALLLVAIAGGAAVGAYRYTTVWTPLQRLFLSPYLRSEFASALAFKTGRYRLLQVVDRKGTRLPLDEEVQPLTTATDEATFALSDLGVQAGDLRLVWQVRSYDHSKLHAALCAWIYRDQTLTDLAMPTVWATVAVFLVGLVIAIPKDLARARARRHGRRLKGPELVTAATFNRRTRADGIGFVQTPSVAARLCGRQRWIRMPRAIESSHVLIMGDTGTGKSALIRQILLQLEDRGDTAIVYDPALEYTNQFYTPERGDVILNPLDERSPYWSPGDELRHDAEALTLATSLFPDRHNENPFFTEGPRRIFAHLLTFRPTAQELASWLCHEDELDRRVRGTSYAAMIDRQAPAQRSGVLASLNMVADTLQLLPAEHDTTQRWSAAAWARERQGWLFLTSTPETRTRLVPLTSLWLDMLVLRLMNLGQSSRRPVWFILDELASLQRLPQLHTAITENRKSNNPVVLGFQGRSQLETRYGHDAEAMLSQPATKIFLGTSEPHAAKWIADTIGEIEIERLRESRSSAQWGQRSQQSYGLERQVEPLVMASEIGGLAPLRGYLKLGESGGSPARTVLQASESPSGIYRAALPDVTYDDHASRSSRGIQRGAGTTPHSAQPHSSGPATALKSGARGLLPIGPPPMLTISKPLSAGQARRYHAEEFQNARENYYAESERIVGTWHGKLAAEWGLSGEVREGHFQRLSEGQHPITGETLVRHQTSRTSTNARGETVTTMEHRAGWDATFSAPKTVSLTALVGDDARIREAHETSVDVALDELERYVQARLGGNRPAETTGNWAAAKFEHDSARPVNGYAAPQLHTHVVVFNLTHTVEGDIRPLQPRELYKTQQYATAVYRSELATRLAALGYEIERGKSGQPEITGYSHEYVEASSPRRRQIEGYLAKEHQQGAAASQIAAHQTREAKLDMSHDEVQQQHRVMAKAFGDQPVRVVQLAQERSHGVEHEAPRVSAHAAVTFAKERNLEREAVVDERAVVRDALMRSMRDVTVGEIKAEFEKRVETGEFIALDQRPGESGRTFTTPEMLDLEQDTIRMMRAGQDSRPALASVQTRSDIENDNQHLSESQRAAVDQILASRDQVQALEGVAGAGKTTALSAIRDAAEREGYQVEGFAPTSRAAQKLAEAGITSTTLQRHLTQTHEPDEGQKRLYVLDESSLASTKQMNEFLHRLNPDDRVLLVGDVRQHQAVDAGRPYQQLQEAGIETARLDDIVRQKDPALKAVVEQLSRGDVRAAIQGLDAQGRVHEIGHRDERLREIAREYTRHPERTLVVSPDNQSRMEINDEIHRSRQTAGQVAHVEHRARVLVPRQEITGADRQWAERYEPGDVVRYTKGSKAQGIEAGEYTRVEQVNARENLLTVTRENGERVTYDPRRLQGVTLYRETDRAFAEGDRVQFTAPFRERHVANRELGTIERIDMSGHLQLRLDSGRTVAFKVEQHPHLDYGYAVTSHSSQGQTADRVLVHVDTDRAGEQLVNRRLAYVAVSRGRYDAQIYTNDKSRIGEALSRDVSQRSAMEPTPSPESSTTKTGQSVARRRDVQLTITR